MIARPPGEAERGNLPVRIHTSAPFWDLEDHHIERFVIDIPPLEEKQGKASQSRAGPFNLLIVRFIATTRARNLRAYRQEKIREAAAAQQQQCSHWLGL